MPNVHAIEAAIKYDRIKLFLKGTASSCLLVISVIIVIMGITTPGCTLLGVESPMVAIALLLGAFVLLGYNEAFQGRIQLVSFYPRYSS